MTETKWDVAERVLKNAIENYDDHKEWGGLPFAMSGARHCSVLDALREHSDVINAATDAVHDRAMAGDFARYFAAMPDREKLSACHLALRIIQRKRRGER